MATQVDSRPAHAGAGLPALDRLLAMTSLTFHRLAGDHASFSARFEEEQATICALTSFCEGPRRSLQVPIPRLRGLDPESRHWSLWMVLDHLRGSNLQFAGIISRLAEGQAPEAPFCTAATLPAPNLQADVERGFADSCSRFLATVSPLATPADTARPLLRHPHPSFGLLDAAGWHALAAMHMATHRAQIVAIIKALPP